MTAQTAAAQIVSTIADTGRPARPAGYWARVDHIVSSAPPLTDDQRARIRAAFHTPAAREAA